MPTLIQRCVIYNSEIIIELDEYFDQNKRRMFEMGYENMLNNLQFKYIYGYQLVERSALKIDSQNHLVKDKRTPYKTKFTNKGSTENNPVYANGVDNFVRLSAYPDDKRVDLTNKKLLPGSYATSEEDYISCKNENADPIDRYALPNDDTVKFAFFIKPISSDQFRPGIVQPNFGHTGGGIEALFDQGTSENTFLYKQSYLDD